MKRKKRPGFKPHHAKPVKKKIQGRLNTKEAELQEEKISKGHFFGKKWYPYNS